MVAFPLSPVPSTYGQANWLGASQPRNGIFYVGGTAPVITLTKAGSTAYSVRDYEGNIVSSGSVSAVATSVTPAAPAGGWRPGWYRAYFTGPVDDTLFGTSYAITNFVVLRNDAHFVATPAGNLLPSGWGSSEYYDPIAKGVLGMGVSRLVIPNPSVPEGDPDFNTLSGALALVSQVATWAPSVDSFRSRPMWCAFTTRTVDFLGLPGASSGTYLMCYCKDGTIDGSKVFVRLEAGSVSGRKITVRFPDAVTIVETYDNQADATAAATAINAASIRIKVFTQDSASGGTQAATAIGNSYFTGVASCVSSLYAAGVTRFEGPSNEPTLNAEIAHQMRLFQAAVHNGNASAKAIGPAPVTIVALSQTWVAFLDAGGGSYCDEISFHAYSAMTNGDLNLARYSLDAFVALLASYGLGSVPLWQTESTQAMTPVYRIHHPRRARTQLMATLLMEQYGIPRERNNPWYDVSHGFWDFPTWWQNTDGSLQPQAVMARVLAEETWGKAHSARLDFGGVADNIFFGSRYNGSSTSVLVLMATSYMPNSTVTIATNAAGPLTVVDAFGNESTVTVTGGLATVSVRDTPVYVRLALSNTATISTVNGWSTLFHESDDLAPHMFGYAAGSPNTVINSGGFITNYESQTGIYVSAGGPPENLELHPPITPLFRHAIERVIVWCGSVWQADSTLLTFNVQTSQDLVNWATVASVDVSSGSNGFKAGSDAQNVGCQYETYWPEQWVFDVPLSGAPAVAVRVAVTATSYGGEPTDAIEAVGGQGNTDQHVAVQRVAVFGAATSAPLDSAPRLECRTFSRI